MKVTIKETITEEIDCLIDVLCNKCGESCVPSESRNHGTPVKYNPDTGVLEIISEEEHVRLRGPDVYGLIEVMVSGGYYSKDPIHDMCDYTFSLCESCLGELFTQFKIPVKKEELLD